jgi:hypothetical protein
MDSPSNTNPGILAAGLYASAAALRATFPPLVQRFARLLSPSAAPSTLYRFAPLDPSLDDGWTAIVPSLGGGAWLDVPDDDRGLDLTEANGYATSGSYTIGAYGGPWRVLPVSTLTGNLTIALDLFYSDEATSVRRGSSIVLTRLDASANTVTVTSGVSGPTISTMPASSQAWGWFWNDGAGTWWKRASGLMI